MLSRFALGGSPVDVSAVEPLVDEFFAENGVPGLAYGVVLDGGLIHSGGRGRRRTTDGPTVPDADTVFRIASMTKSFTASTVLALRDDGLLSLDDPIAIHLPHVTGMGLPTRDSAPITIRQVLTMSAGLPTDDPWGDRQQGLPIEDFDALVGGGLRFAWPNGTEFEYSNLGYALLGRLISTVAGRDYRDVVQARFLDPLGLSATGYTPDHLPADRLALGYRVIDGRWVEVPLDPYGAFAPMGGLFSSVRDLGVWVSGYTAALPARDDEDPEPVGSGSGSGSGPPHPLRRATRRELQQPHRGMAPQLAWTSIDTAPVARVTSYGFGLFIEHDAVFGTVVGHSGGYPGFGSNMRWHLESGLGVVVLANSTYAQAPRLGARMLRTLVERLGPVDAARAAGRPPTVDASAASPANAPVSAPRTGAIWPETVAAQADVEQLIASWDGALAARLLATNIDLDESLDRRRAQLSAVSTAIGPLTRDPSAEVGSDSPAHLQWWLRGPGGRARVEIRLTPQRPPLVQTLTVTAVPEPSAALRSAALTVLDAIGSDDPRWPATLSVAGGLDPAQLTRQVRVASGWAGASRLGEPEAGDGSTEATFRTSGTYASLLLQLGLDSSGAATKFSLRPAG